MKQKSQKLVQQIINGALVLVVIGLLGFLSVRFEVKQDWTFNKRNTLTEGSRKQLASMDKPIKLVAFVYPGSDDRATVQYFADQYRRFKKDVDVEFVDPTTQPQKVKQYDITAAGDVVIEYDGRKESLHSLSEQTITGALQRLSFKGEKWVVFVTGHGEREVTETRTQNDYTQFAAVLKDKGLNVQPLNLVKAQAIPDNTAALVLADPKSALLDAEVKLIVEYVKKGGNLVWLSDTDEGGGLDPLADALGVKWQKGVGIFPFEYKMLGTESPVIYVATEYPQNVVTAGLDQLTWFPMVHSLEAKKDSGWVGAPLLIANESSWLETQPIGDAPVSMDKAAGDIPGPLTLAMTLTRDVKAPAAEKPAPATAAADAAAKPDDKAADAPKDPAAPEAGGETHQQRVALVGDADFLANANLSQLGNQQLGLNLVQWAASRDSQLNIDVPKAPDTNLFLQPWADVALRVFFVLALPLTLFGIGIARFVLRRRR